MTALPFILRNWKYLAGAVAVIGLLFLHSRWTQAAYNEAYNAGWSVEHARLENLKADYRTAYERGRADNLADVRAKETDAATLVETKQHDIEILRAQARALAADYARGLRAASATNSGSASEARVGEVAGAPINPFRAGGVSLLDEDDVRICTDNTIKALGWPKYYTPLRARYNADGQP